MGYVIIPKPITAVVAVQVVADQLSIIGVQFVAVSTCH